MGPQLCSCGNFSVATFLPPKALSLQWGRNFAVAETPRQTLGALDHRSASMGPQLCSCGNAPEPGHVPCRHQLQWGRNFAVAETIHNKDVLRMCYMLQWGRNFAVAETSALVPAPLLESVASMGPQLCSCGNYVHTRGRSAVAACFNGAATLQLRKRDGKTIPLRETVSLQWGRNFAVAETVYRIDYTGEAPPRFNGAATLQLRKLLEVHSTRSHMASLQWGRNFAVAETRIPEQTHQQIMSASMGPQLCSCGNWKGNVPRCKSL